MPVDIVQLIVSLLIGAASGIISGLIIIRTGQSQKAAFIIAIVFFIVGAVGSSIGYSSIVLREVPDLNGLSKDEAYARLQDEELIPVYTEQYDSTTAKGRVFSQDLSPGLRVRKGSEVHYIVSKGTPTPPAPPPTTTLTLPIEGWENQTYFDSQGITAVRPEGDQLVLQAHLIDGHPNYTKGEIYLDLRNAGVPNLKVPINMIGKEISVLVKVQKEFVGDPKRPNGVQVFVKDSNWKSQYGPWKNIKSANTWIKITLSPTAGEIPLGYTEKGFDASDIILIGVKFGMGTGSNEEYDGLLYVTNISIIR